MILFVVGLRIILRDVEKEFCGSVVEEGKYYD